MVDTERLSAVRSAALLWLAPVRPRTVTVAGSVALDPAVTEAWDLCVVSTGADLAIAAAEVPPAESAVVCGPSATARAASLGGYSVATYRLRWARRGELVAVPARRGATRLRVPSSGRTPWSVLAMASQEAADIPAVVRAAVPGAALLRLTVSPHARRRTSFVVMPPGATRQERSIIKAGVGAHGAGRADPEQTMLREIERLGLGDAVPRAGGSGDLDGLHWSVESEANGRPIARARRPWWLRHGGSIVRAMARWLDDLAIRSARSVPARPAPERGIAVVGEAAAWVRPALGALADVPAIVTHGDLATGENVLVSGSGFWVVDWETSTAHGVPLVDLLPFTCWALARRRGLSRPAEQAAFVLELCRGTVGESRLLFGIVQDHLRGLVLDEQMAGPLAAIAWAHHGSMRARHVSMVRSAGGEPSTWVSMSELVLQGWMRDDSLALTWSALGAASAP